MELEFARRKILQRETELSPKGAKSSRDRRSLVAVLSNRLDALR
jgi:hypothetical protein